MKKLLVLVAVCGFFYGLIAPAFTSVAKQQVESGSSRITQAVDAATR